MNTAGSKHKEVYMDSKQLLWEAFDWLGVNIGEGGITKWGKLRYRKIKDKDGALAYTIDAAERPQLIVYRKMPENEFSQKLLILTGGRHETGVRYGDRAPEEKEAITIEIPSGISLPVSLNLYEELTDTVIDILRHVLILKNDLHL